MTLNIFNWNVYTEKIYNPNAVVVVSFFTASNFYKQDAEFMIESMKTYKINHRVYEVKPNTTYDFNTHERHLYVDNCSEENISFSQIPKLKPRICKHALETFSSIMWVDCDSIFAKYPKECCFWINRELGVYRKEDGRIAGGVLYFRKNIAITKFLDEWDKLSQELWNNTDQCALTKLLSSTSIPYFILPFHFIVKFDTIPPVYIPTYVTILHFQAERRMKLLLSNNRKEYYELQNRVRRLQSTGSSVL